ncbi:hypothetical protein CRM95_14395 [Burkholderia gladioli]|nr:hypothetical protein CRM95_14395 [Burkholderia gladioli]
MRVHLEFSLGAVRDASMRQVVVRITLEFATVNSVADSYDEQLIAYIPVLMHRPVNCREVGEQIGCDLGARIFRNGGLVQADSIFLPRHLNPRFYLVFNQ